MWLAELLAGVLHGFGDIMTSSRRGQRIVVAMAIAIAAVVAYVVLA